jgi:uncharacterized protein
LDRRSLLIRVAFPAAGFLGRMLPEAYRERLERWCIGRNNALVAGSHAGACGRMLLLLPHCLQFDGCPRRLTGSVLNCEKCGKCRVRDLLTLGEKYNIIIKVATGGRLARRIVGEASPDMVVAVACERELSEGIFSVYPLPVYGIPNIRLSGPCINTDVDIDAVRQTLDHLLKKKK